VITRFVSLPSTLLIGLFFSCQSPAALPENSAGQSSAVKFSVEDDREYVLELIREIESEAGSWCGTRLVSLTMEFSKYGDAGWDLLESEFRDPGKAKQLRLQYWGE
jgi:hypothetical protein